VTHAYGGAVDRPVEVDKIAILRSSTCSNRGRIPESLMVEITNTIKADHSPLVALSEQFARPVDVGNGAIVMGLNSPLLNARLIFDLFA